MFIIWLDSVRTGVKISAHHVAHIRMQSVTKIAAQSVVMELRKLSN